MKRKLFALIMAAVMCLGMSMTVFAATNESPDATTRPNDPGTSTRPEPTISEIYNSEILWKASIAAGGGIDPAGAQSDCNREIKTACRRRKAGKHGRRNGF